MITTSSPNAGARPASSGQSSRAAPPSIGRPRSRTGSRAEAGLRARGSSTREARLRAGEQATGVLSVEPQYSDGGEGGEADDRPGRAEREAEHGERDRREHRGERGVAREREGDEPDRGAAQRGERRKRQRDPAGRRDHLPALREAEKDGTRMAEHRRRPGEHADPVAAEPEPERGGDEALEDVEHRHWQAQRATVDPPDVRRAHVPTAVATDVVAAEKAGKDIAERDRADEVGGKDEEAVADHGVPARRVRRRCRTRRSIR